MIDVPSYSSSTERVRLNCYSQMPTIRTDYGVIVRPKGWGVSWVPSFRGERGRKYVDKFMTGWT